MNQPVSTDVQKQLFLEARTHKGWQKREVSNELLHELFDLAKWGPTSVNSLPMRVVFVKSAEAKSKLVPALMNSNVAQVQAAPVTAIIAYDEKFYDQLPMLMPAFDAKAPFVNDPELAKMTAIRNGSLQGAYLMIAARALGLDVGPMSGFDNAKVDQAFFSGTTWKSNFICNIGIGDAAKLYPRGPRLAFDVAARIL